jgi:GNAT superfamily N-acetyltransferase
VTIAETTPADPDTRWCFDRFADELDRRFPGGFRYDHALPLDGAELTPPRGLVLLARQGGRPVGCAGLKLLGGGLGEVKRVWVAAEARGSGVGRRLMDGIEDRARVAGCERLRLETNDTLVEAIAMYRKRGYREVPAFNDEQYADHWFEKDLADGAMS